MKISSDSSRSVKEQTKDCQTYGELAVRKLGG